MRMGVGVSVGVMVWVVETPCMASDAMHGV
jgi:hypothetical protein